MSMEFEFNPEDFSLDLQDLKTAAEEEPDSAGDKKEDTDSLVGSLGLESPDEGGGIKPADDAGDLGLAKMLPSSPHPCFPLQSV